MTFPPEPPDASPARGRSDLPAFSGAGPDARPRPEHEEPAEPERVELLAAETTQERGSRVRVRVRLGRGEETGEGVAEGVGTELVWIRLAAEATLDALQELMGEAGRFRLVGVKEVHAFDAEVVLVAVVTSSPESGKLVGALAATHGPVDAGARAVLDAVNRLITREPDAD